MNFWRLGLSPPRVASNVWQPRNAMSLETSLKTAMHRRPRQVRDRWLQCMETVLSRQEHVPPERNHNRVFVFARNACAEVFRPGLEIPNRFAFTPRRHRLGIDPKRPAQLRDRSLRSLYCRADRLRGRGASMTSMSRNASVHSKERSTQSKHGMKHAVGSYAALNESSARTGLFGLFLRQTTGFVERLFRLVDLRWNMPDCSPFCRRQKTLNVGLPYRRDPGPRHLLVDSPGIRAQGEGARRARKYAGPKRRIWRRILIDIDE